MGAGFMDVISIEKSDEYFRLVYDIRGRFNVLRISKEEASYKLARVKKLEMGAGGVPYVVTHDGRTIRYPDPNVKVNDTVKIELADNKITDIDLRDGQHRDDLRREEHWPRRHDRPPRAAPGLLRHGPGQGCAGTHLCHSPVQRLCHRQGDQADGVAAEAQGHQEDHHGGAHGAAAQAVDPILHPLSVRPLASCPARGGSPSA